MISTTWSIILTQIPIAIAIVYAVIEVRKTKKELLRILDKLADKVKERTSSAGAYLAVLLKSGQQILNFVKEKKSKKTTKKTNQTQSK